MMGIPTTMPGMRRASLVAAQKTKASQSVQNSPPLQPLEPLSGKRGGCTYLTTVAQVKSQGRARAVFESREFELWTRYQLDFGRLWLFEAGRNGVYCSRKLESGSVHRDNGSVITHSWRPSPPQSVDVSRDPRVEPARPDAVSTGAMADGEDKEEGRYR